MAKYQKHSHSQTKVQWKRLQSVATCKESNEFLQEEKKKIMVFFSTCACVEYFGVALGRLLKGLVDVTAIHGKKAKRDRVFDSFRKKAESGEGQFHYGT